MSHSHFCHTRVFFFSSEREGELGEAVSELRNRCQLIIQCKTSTRVPIKERGSAVKKITRRKISLMYDSGITISGSFFGDGSFFCARARRTDGRIRALTYESIAAALRAFQNPGLKKRNFSNFLEIRKTPRRMPTKPYGCSSEKTKNTKL